MYVRFFSCRLYLPLLCLVSTHFTLPPVHRLVNSVFDADPLCTDNSLAYHVLMLHLESDLCDYACSSISIVCRGYARFHSSVYRDFKLAPCSTSTTLRYREIWKLCVARQSRYISAVLKPTASTLQQTFLVDRLFTKE